MLRRYFEAGAGVERELLDQTLEDRRHVMPELELEDLSAAEHRHALLLTKADHRGRLRHQRVVQGQAHQFAAGREQPRGAAVGHLTHRAAAAGR